MNPVRISIILLAAYFSQCAPKKDAPADPELNLLNQALDQDPMVDSLYFKRAQYYFQNENYSLATMDLQKAISIDSSKAPYYHLLADVRMDGGDSYEALQIMKETADRFPNRIPTLLKLSEYQNILKQYDQSLQTILSILKLDPLNADAYLMAGLDYRDLQDTVNAIKSFQKATTYDDQNRDAWIMLSQLLPEKDSVLALKYLNNAIKIDTTNTSALHALAAYYQIKNPLRSIEIYRHIIELDPGYTDAYINSGILYFSMDSMVRALADFNIACVQSPTEAKYYYYRGTAKEGLKDLLGAKEDYAQALKLNHNLKEVQDALKQLK